ncbi:flagellar hook-associated protein 3 [Methylophilaceae bacterium 11]|jgi:flagellar hook-associated protein 3 FlgL|uniref:flagellar hook-associated protein FlgL n=1 Tax=Methylotenera sp. N17 TaxID=1502761 RepID=UPI0004509D08|nr:flagellar hook-associated protein FlgL [Methylotenera sp. N17]EUJ10713.1 flagellar hook-associated protein 3 [Methylophilaceae bacterium 11]
MRISTNTLFDSGIQKITGLQSDQARLQGQISTGKRFTTPSDDPVAAARVLEISQQKEMNATYANVRTVAKTNLETIEANLTNITNLMVAAQSTLVGAGNGAYSNLERSFVATDLKNSLEALVGMANGKDAYGNYLFSGFKSETAPFTANTTGATYNGDSNVQQLQVDSQRLMDVSVSGSQLFLANGNDVFATLNDIVNLLNTPITDATTQANFSNGLATAITKMQSSVDNIMNVRASVGSKLNELDNLDISGQDRDLQYASSLSDIQDLDYAEALSEFSKNQTIMEAAQKSFSSTAQLSLFDFI